MGDNLVLSADSRYKDTPVYTGDEGFEFGLFEAPPEFTESQEGTHRHRVRKHEVGFLDKLAVEYYGPGSERLWWIIAMANGIIDPEEEMYTGMLLSIPPRSKVLSFTSRQPNG